MEHGHGNTMNNREMDQFPCFFMTHAGMQRSWKDISTFPVWALWVTGGCWFANHKMGEILNLSICFPAAKNHENYPMESGGVLMVSHGWAERFDLISDFTTIFVVEYPISDVRFSLFIDDVSCHLSGFQDFWIEPPNDVVVISGLSSTVLVRLCQLYPYKDGSNWVKLNGTSLIVFCGSI